MLIYVILLSSDCLKVQGHLVPRLYLQNTRKKLGKSRKFEAKTRNYLVICFYFPLPDYHSNHTHLYYKIVKLTEFSSAVNRADSYMKLKFL